MSRFLLFFLLAGTVFAQQGPVVTSQLNSTYYVKQVPGFYATIQAAVTKACSVSTGGQVVIPAGATPADTIAGATGGCTTARLIDERGGTAPSVVYAWNGSQYAAVSSSGGSGMTSLTGAVTAAGPGAAAATITPTGVSAGTYTLGSYLVSVNAAGQITSVAAVGTPFSITGFSGPSGTVELGTSFVNPAFTASYSTTPTSASITNTDAIDSPQSLSTPFTSGTVTGTFTHAAVATTTFTLTATSGGSQTSSLSINWQPAIFGGVGAAGATSSVTASGATARLSTADALARVQLGAETVGQTFGPFSPTGQTVYLLLTGGSHSFIDANTGFPFSFNAPIAVGFVNVNGVTVPLYLYASTNPLTGTFAPKVTS